MDENKEPVLILEQEVRCNRFSCKHHKHCIHGAGFDTQTGWRKYKSTINQHFCFDDLDNAHMIIQVFCWAYEEQE